MWPDMTYYPGSCLGLTKIPKCVSQDSIPPKIQTGVTCVTAQTNLVHDNIQPHTHPLRRTEENQNMVLCPGLGMETAQR